MFQEMKVVRLSILFWQVFSMNEFKTPHIGINDLDLFPQSISDTLFEVRFMQNLASYARFSELSSDNGRDEIRRIRDSKTREEMRDYILSLSESAEG